jgi:hypothetical protein
VRAPHAASSRDDPAATSTLRRSITGRA